MSKTFCLESDFLSKSFQTFSLKSLIKFFFACSHKAALVTASRKYEKRFLSRSILEKMSKKFCLESDILSSMIRAISAFFSLCCLYLSLQISDVRCPQACQNILFCVSYLMKPIDYFFLMLKQGRNQLQIVPQIKKTKM